MHQHCGRRRASSHQRGGRVAAAAIAAWLGAVVTLPAVGGEPQRNNDNDRETVETEDLFGFVEGTDIGRAGEREIEVDQALRYGKSGGTYQNDATTLQFKYTAFKDFRISTMATFAYYDISGVPGLMDMNRAALQSLSFDARFRMFDRERAPFGLALSFVPHWGFADETTGIPLKHFGWQGVLLADREWVPDKLVGAFNFEFDTDRTRLLPDGAVEQAPVLSFGAALAWQLRPGLWLGGETRYLRSYQGAALDVFSGQALYAGPTIYSEIGKNGWVSFALDFQLRGGAVGVPGALDLVNFERYQAMLRGGIVF
jgi:hypothetical protein